MAKKAVKNHTPLFRIAKRDTSAMAWYFPTLVRAVAIIAALVVSAVVIMLLSEKNPIAVYESMFKGVFGTERRIWNTLQSTAILLCISLAVTPAFKMRFWNCGAEGQVLVGGLASVSVMLFLGGKLPLPLLIVVMILASVTAGMVWALIPAIFKSIWNTK